ncbi:MAG: DUF4097 family beta strand repeat protein [Candidatus Cloacimonetes bacterium]|nr:DUF4097 family beta strand repeat protein [Candidatus Cloacimonadota bacterium]
MNRFLCLMFLLLASLTLPAITQEFQLTADTVTLEFENIKIRDIIFHKSDQVKLRYDSKEEVQVEAGYDRLKITAPHEAGIKLYLPDQKTYVYHRDNSVYTFTPRRMSILGAEGELIEFDEKRLIVQKDGTSLVEISERGIMVEDDDEKVTIGKEGIIVQSDDEDTQLTGFWGKLLGSVIKSIAHTSVTYAGKRPEKIARLVINDDGDNDFVLGGDMDWDTDSTERKGKSGKETYTPTEPSEITLLNRNGSVQIEAWDEDFLELSWEMTSLKGKSELEKVQVDISWGRLIEVETVHLQNNPRVSVKYEIKIPANVTLEEISTSNGAIQIRGTAGDGQLQTSNGRITIKDHQGNLTAHTSNGKIKASDITGDLDASTSNGSLSIENIRGQLKAVTSNGSIEISKCSRISELRTSNSSISAELPVLQENVVIRTSNGSVRLWLDPHNDLKLNASTSNGKIRHEGLALEVTKSSRDSLSAIFNSGLYNMNITTSNGNIELKELETVE